MSAQDLLLDLATPDSNIGRNKRFKRSRVCNRRTFETIIFGTLIFGLASLNFYWLRQYPAIDQHHRTRPTPLTFAASSLQAKESKQTAVEKNSTQKEDKGQLYDKLVHDRDRSNLKRNDHKMLINRLPRRNAVHRNKTGFNHRRSKHPPPDDYLSGDLEQPPANYWNNHIPLAGKEVSLNFTRSVPYLGVLIDAGRHYFEMDWLYQILDILHALQYNWVHFRLTDDQTFNLKLDSWPQLAIPTPLHNQTKVYTPEQLRKLVRYAKDRNISMIPEINVPGHAGAWAGIPGLVVPCPNFICAKGYGVPLNVSHHQLPQILNDVLTEVLDIFDDPPFLHLGGDEVEMSKPCFQEIGQPLPNFTKFEDLLRQTLKDIDYDESKVIRWEAMGSNPKGKDRAGRMLQWWFQIPGEKHTILTRPNDPFVASSGLYMDANGDDGAWEVFLHTRKFLHLNYNYTPTAIVVGTFELDQEFWFDRNILGRLVAVALGASKEIDVANGKELYETYRHYCSNHLNFPDATCTKYAKPNIQTKVWQEAKWKQVMWKQFREGICERLTTPKPNNNRAVGQRLFRQEFLE
jgi:hypothetical protein